MLLIRTLLAVAAFAFLSACATIDQRLNTTAQIHTATTQAVHQALETDLISVKDAEAYLSIAINAAYVLDAARVLKDSDPSTAEGKLKLVDGILSEMQKYLISLEKSK